MAVRRRQHDPGPPHEFAWRVAVGDQSLELRANGGAKVKADVRTSHLPNFAHLAVVGNPLSGDEH